MRNSNSENYKFRKYHENKWKMRRLNEIKRKCAQFRLTRAGDAKHKINLFRPKASPVSECLRAYSMQQEWPHLWSYSAKITSFFREWVGWLLFRLSCTRILRCLNLFGTGFIYFHISMAFKRNEEMRETKKDFLWFFTPQWSVSLGLPEIPG